MHNPAGCQTRSLPGYGELSRGLHDAHLDVGAGTGSTWRPDQLKWLPFGILRIDYLLSSPNLVPLSASTDCTPRDSDHCILSGAFQLER